MILLLFWATMSASVPASSSGLTLTPTVLTMPTASTISPIDEPGGVVLTPVG